MDFSILFMAVVNCFLFSMIMFRRILKFFAVIIVVLYSLFSVFGGSRCSSVYMSASILSTVCRFMSGVLFVSILSSIFLASSGVNCVIFSQVRCLF